MTTILKEVGACNEEFDEDLKRRQIILKELEEEMEKLRTKYLLKYKGQAEIEVKINKGTVEENFKNDKNLEKIEEKVFNEEDKVKQIKENLEKEKTDEMIENLITISEDNNNLKIIPVDPFKNDNQLKSDSNMISLCKNENLKVNNLVKKESEIFEENFIKSAIENFRLSFNFDCKELGHENLAESNRNENKLDAFEKAKEKLLAIKYELDDMDKYDYRSAKFASSKDTEIEKIEKIEKSPAHNYNLSENFNFENSLRTNTTSEIYTKKNIKSKLTSSSKIISKPKANTNTETKQNEIYNDNYFKKLRKEYSPNYRKNRSRDKIEMIKAEIEKKFKEQYTFKPNLGKPTVTRDKTPECKKEFLKRLSTPKLIKVTSRSTLTTTFTESNMNRDKSKDSIRSKPLSKPVSRPVSKPTSVSKSRSKSKDNKQNQVNNLKIDKEGIILNNRIDRIFKLAKERNIRKETQKRQNEENQINNITFKPIIDENSKKINKNKSNQKEKRPLFERYDEIIQKKQENICKLRQLTDKTFSEYFKPKINGRLENIESQCVDEFEPIHERLYRDGISKERLKSNKLRIFRTEADRLLTFTPRIYSTTQTGNIFDFLKRQKSYEKIKREKSEKRSSINQLTFTPDIDPISDFITKEVIKRNEKDNFNRLYKEDFDNLKKKKETLEKFYYSQFNFKPKINDLSKIVGADNSIEDLAVKKESKKLKEIKKKIHEEEIDSKENFYPKINKDKYEKIQPNYKNDQNLLKNIKEKQLTKHEKVKELQREVEQAERKQCKFQPEINKEIPSYENIEPIMIKGFAKYINQMDRARKAKLEKEEREKKAFLTGENWKVENCVTVPKPFNLSSNTNKSRSKDKTREMSPHSNQTKYKNIINSLINE